MNPRVNIGICLVVLGALLVLFGLYDMHTVVDITKENGTGYHTLKTMWTTIGGIVLLVIGAEFIIVNKEEL